MPPLVRMLETTARAEGVLLVDKPAGTTSHDVVAIARRSLGVRRVGHTGTLDPFATGLLVLLAGQATRLARFVDDEPKVYDANIEFGTETDTDDLTGTVIRAAEVPGPEQVDAAILALTGVVRQLPPAYSAKKIGGQRAYAAARAGAPLALQAVDVKVHEWRVRARSARRLDVTITCDGGTYIRALARDLGRLTLSAAHLSSLRRVRSGVFDVRNALTLDDLRGGAAQLTGARAAIPEMPVHLLDATEVELVRHGRPVRARSHAAIIALVDAAGELTGIAERRGDLLHPCVVMQHGL